MRRDAAGAIAGMDYPCGLRQNFAWLDAQEHRFGKFR
jgi:hypothetical protein